MRWWALSLYVVGAVALTLATASAECLAISVYVCIVWTDVRLLRKAAAASAQLDACDLRYRLDSESLWHLELAADCADGLFWRQIRARAPVGEQDGKAAKAVYQRAGVNTLHHDVANAILDLRGNAFKVQLCHVLIAG